MAGNTEVKMLSELADKYRDKARDNPRENWADLLKAHTLYNSCAVRSTNKKWKRLVFEVQEMYWKENVSSTQDQQMSMSLDFKRELYTIRDDCRDELSLVMNLMNKWDCNVDNLDSSHNHHITTNFSDMLQKISSKTSTQMKVLAGKIIQKSVELCGGQTPCKFTAVAMGSLAKGEATPYSDLEFMFLVERKDGEIIKFFELLAMTVYFLIGNIQETKLKYMNISELKNFEDKCKNGFKIDGLQSKAGNIPTGNGTPEQRNKFILTVSELVDQYRSIYLNPDPKEAVKGDLTSMLAHTATLYGDNGLLKEFQMAQRTTKSNAARDAVHEEMIQSDVRDYSFLPLSELDRQNYCVDLKSAIYRFPSLLMYNLKIICNISSVTSWQTMKKLFIMGKLSQSFYHRLTFLLASAIYIRLAAYLHHDSQNERLSFLKRSELRSDTRRPYSTEFWHIPEPLAFHMSVHMIPVKQSIEMKELHEILEILSQDIEYDNQLVAVNYLYSSRRFAEALEILESRCCDSYFEKGMLANSYMQLRNWKKFQPAVMGVLSIFYTFNSSYSPSDQLNWKLKSAVGYSEQGDLTAAKERFDEVMSQIDMIPNNGRKIEAYMQAARFYPQINDELLAAKYYDKGNALIKTISQENEGKKLFILHSKADYLYRTRRYGEAESVVKHNIKLCHQLYGANSCHEIIAYNFSLLGLIYYDIGRTEESLKSLQQARVLIKELNPSALEDGCFVELDIAYADCLLRCGDFPSALQLYKKALQSMSTSTSSHLVPDLNHRIAEVYSRQGNLQAAEKHWKEALSIYSRMDTQYFMDDVANCHCGLGVLLFEKGCRTEALAYCNKVILLESPATTKKYQEILCQAYACIGYILKSEGDFKQAIVNFEKAISARPNMSTLTTMFTLHSYIDLSECYHACNNATMTYHWLKEAFKFLTQRESDSGHREPECFLIVFAYIIAYFKPGIRVGL